VLYALWAPGSSALRADVAARAVAAAAETDDPFLEFKTHIAAYTVAIELADPVAADGSLTRLREIAAAVGAPRMRWTVGIYETFDATMAARFGFDCTIYMGEVDVERQRPNVFWMERLGATVVPVRDGTRILKDAINEAFRDWVSNMDTTHYVLGTACGPHPFPEMVTYFQSVIGQEARRHSEERLHADAHEQEGRESPGGRANLDHEPALGEKLHRRGERSKRARGEIEPVRTKRKESPVSRPAG